MGFNSNDWLVGGIKHAANAVGGFVGDFDHGVYKPSQGTLKPKPKPKPIQGPQIKPGYKPKPKPSPKPKPASKPPSRVVTRNGTQSSVRATSGGGSRTGASGGASKPKTFTDSHGNVRRVRATRPAARNTTPAKDPINDLVDEIIAGMNAPLVDQKRQVAEQSIGNITQNNRLGDFYNEQLGGLRSTGQMDLGDAINKAAQLKGLSASTIAANQDYLRSLMAPTHGGTGDAQVAAAGAQTQGDLAAVNDQLAGDIAARAGNVNDWLVKQQAIGRTHQEEMNRREGLAKQAAQRDLDGQIAANRGKAAQMRYEMSQAEAEQDLKALVAEREWGLDAAKFRADNQYRYDKLGQDGEIAAARLDAQAAKDAAKKNPKIGRYGNIPAKYDTAIDKVYQSVHGLQPSGVKDDKTTPDVDESRSPVSAPWRTAWNQLTDRAGLNPTTAALLATKWFPDSVGPAKSNPFNILVMLRNRRVSPAGQRRIIDNAYGAGTYSKLLKNPAGALGEQVGGLL